MIDQEKVSQTSEPQLQTNPEFSSLDDSNYNVFHMQIMLIMLTVCDIAFLVCSLLAIIPIMELILTLGQLACLTAIYCSGLKSENNGPFVMFVKMGKLWIKVFLIWFVGTVLFLFFFNSNYGIILANRLVTYYLPGFLCMGTKFMILSLKQESFLLVYRSIAERFRIIRSKLNQHFDL